MARQYRMKKRATARDETRERIIRATMALHDEQGVASTSFADIATRAGVGAATVLRHFPTVGDLVLACGQRIAAEMRPPGSEDAARIFDGLQTTGERLTRLAEELDAFYQRGELRLVAAANDRDRVPELDGFLRIVDAGIEALVRAALAGEQPDETQIGVMMALCDIAVWRRIRKSEPRQGERRALFGAILEGVAGVLLKNTERR